MCYFSSQYTALALTLTEGLVAQQWEAMGFARKWVWLQ